ncbi:energy transducer TonB [Bacteroides sp. 51]|uniref:energy transducer TonB n=1 Tax=Bacteroides sp. 51 TaxID=2302938 RepID=UPI0013D881FB|nr:energy transducer TonB [Bacteroides sp. 51]NDV82283.1 energy transducer TonB [Bacteroides sp. 51]
MEVKKTKRADIESHRGTWLLMGFIAVLTFMFVAFEWAQYDKQIDTSMAVKDLVYTADLIPITVPEKPLPPPPAAQRMEEIVIVDDTSPEPEGTVMTSENVGEAVTPIYIKPEVEEIIPDETEIVVFAEVMPSFPGGGKALNAFLAKHIKYPTLSQEIGSQGRVIVQFVVDKDGTITNAEVVKGIDPHLDKEALRVINLMPKWSPGMQNRKPVRVKYTVPVIFKLQ